jgi:hypothetical protein
MTGCYRCQLGDPHTIHETAAETFPAPEVACRLATEEEIPRTAKTLRRKAEAAGWTVRATYARGTRPGRPPRVVDSVALRMTHPERGRAVAVWLDGGWSVGLAPGRLRVPARQMAEALSGG